MGTDPKRPYETGRSSDGAYFYARKFHGPYTAETAQSLASEFAHYKDERNIKGCLVDIRGTSSVSSVMDKYDFAYKKTKEVSLPRHWKYAFIKDPDDKSLEFIETVMRNAGYQFCVFEDEGDAVNWLSGEQSA
jgi:hypothetical protein